jgi:RHS repeat-associated protein
MALVSASGDTFNGAYFYGAFGETNVEARGGGTTADSNPWRYAGGYDDAQEGDNYYHFGARYYAPTQGRWTQADPQQGSINDPATLMAYAYGNDDPTNQTDGSGRLSTGQKVGIGIAAAGLAMATVGFGVLAVGGIAAVAETFGVEAMFGTIGAGEVGSLDFLGTAGMITGGIFMGIGTAVGVTASLI